MGTAGAGLKAAPTGCLKMERQTSREGREKVLKGRWRRKIWGYLLSLALIFISLFPWPGIFYDLQVTHLESQRKFLTFPFFAGQTFQIVFTNSLYMAPVSEVFEVQGPTIYLKEIVSRSREVIDYYNIPGTISHDNGEIKIQNINFKIARLTMMIGFLGKQRLIWKDQTYPLYDLTGPGGILQIEAESLSLGHFFWQMAIHSAPEGEIKNEEG